MGLFRKKKKELDDLPLLTDDLPPLPALPKESKKEDFPENRPFIPATPKSNFLDKGNFPKLESQNKAPKGPKPMPLETRHEVPPQPEIPPQKKNMLGMEKETRKPNISFTGKVEGKKANIFVKLDKYNEIMETLEDLEGKTHDLEKIIRKLEETKDKEKDLIFKWNELLIETKKQIEKVNKNLPSA